MLKAGINGFLTKPVDAVRWKCAGDVVPSW